MTEYAPPEDPEVFRAELRQWLDDHAPRALWNTVSTPFQGHWGGKSSEFETEAHRIWFELCLERGWTAPDWPRSVGGGGMSSVNTRVFREELLVRGLPHPIVGFGLAMIGPIILIEGTDEQREDHVRKIVRGEIRWCQGYSEPDAGSDLANLRMRADRDGDEFVVNGQKVWTSHAEKADWIFCLVRTSSEGRKQGGITFLLIDMTTPGVSVRPIQLISGASPFSEVFMEDVRVPVGNVVGAIDDGWRVAKALLAHERSMVGESIAAGGARLQVLQSYRLRDHALEQLGLGPDGRLSDPLIRDAIARNEMEQAAFRLTLQRVNDKLRGGQHPGAESSILKVVGTELNQRRWELGVQIAAETGLGWEGDGYTDRDLALCRQWLRSRGNTIEGGTSEVQRNILARRVLLLPKGR